MSKSRFLCLCLSVCLSVCLYLSIYLLTFHHSQYISISTSLSLSPLSLSLSLSLYIYIYICVLFFSLFAYFSIDVQLFFTVYALSLCLSLCLSVSLIHQGLNQKHLIQKPHVLDQVKTEQCLTDYPKQLSSGFEFRVFPSPRLVALAS